MSKKSFKDNPALAFIGNAQRTEPEEERTQQTHNTQETRSSVSAKYYRLNLKLKAEYKEYLDQVSWEAHKSITQYLNDLIQADKDTRDT